jgi:hypothetical protein
MSSIIKVKRSDATGTAPTTTNLQPAELAINTADGILYSANSTVAFEVGSNLTHISVTGDASFQANAVVGSTLLDGSNRAFKVYYSNGDIAWG